MSAKFLNFIEEQNTNFSTTRVRKMDHTWTEVELYHTTTKEYNENDKFKLKKHEFL